MDSILYEFGGAVMWIGVLGVCGILVYGLEWLGIQVSKWKVKRGKGSALDAMKVCKELDKRNRF